MVFYKVPVIFHKLVGQDLQTCCHGFGLQVVMGDNVEPRREFIEKRALQAGIAVSSMPMIDEPRR